MIPCRMSRSLAVNESAPSTSMICCKMSMPATITGALGIQADYLLALGKSERTEVRKQSVDVGYKQTGGYRTYVDGGITTCGIRIRLRHGAPLIQR